jgi:2',3'-cyclic-nucleotide 2'-phosphodiesterase (5'-nucleotidase family)
MKKIEILSAVFLAICIALTGLASSYPDPLENETLEVQILAINDLHDHLEPPQGTVRVGYNSDCQPVQVGGRWAPSIWLPTSRG